MILMDEKDVEITPEMEEELSSMGKGDDSEDGEH